MFYLGFIYDHAIISKLWVGDEMQFGGIGLKWIGLI